MALPRWQTIIKTFLFNDERRYTNVEDPSSYAFSDSSLLTQTEGEWVELKKTSADVYPVGTEALLYGGIWEAQSFRQFKPLFQAGVANLEDPDGGRDDTAKVFRVYNGGGEFYHNGAAWVAATLDAHWNTEGELSAAIAQWSAPLVDQDGYKGQFGFIVRLYTSDKTRTPRVHWLKCAYGAKVHSWIEDAIVRSLVPLLKAQIRPVTELVIKAPATPTNKVNIASILSAASAPFNIVDVDDAYNVTQDTEMVYNLDTAYDSETKLLTLSEVPDADDVIRIGAIYAPPVEVEVGNQDFIEVAKAPSVLIHSIGFARATQMPLDENIVSKWNNTALTVKAPYRATITFDLTMIAPTNFDLLRMIDCVLEFFEANPTIQSKAIGESYRLRLMDKFQNRTQAAHSGTFTARARGEIIDVLFFKRPAVAGKGVEQVTLQAPESSSEVGPSVIIDIEVVDGDTDIGE